MLGVLYPWALALLVLCPLPLLKHVHHRVGHSKLAAFPRDPLGTCLELSLRALGALAIAALALGISGLHRPAYEVQRIGQGAQIVLLLDRSLSMDQPFAGAGTKIHALEGAQGSKGQVARELLAEFVAQRDNDMFGMLIFSTFPISVLPLTQKQDIVKAAIDAGRVGRGLAETDIGRGLEQAAAFFHDRAYTGSRVVVLVSDGAAELDLGAQLRVTQLMAQHRISLYWIYIRTPRSPGIFEAPSGHEESAPERELHEFFSAMGTPYRAYTAENPSDLERAISDVGRLQNLPIRYQETIPRRSLSRYCYWAALAALSLLVLAKLLEVQSWTGTERER